MFTCHSMLCHLHVYVSGLTDDGYLLRSCPNIGESWIGVSEVLEMIGDGGSSDGLWLQLWCCTHNKYGLVFQRVNERRWMWTEVDRGDLRDTSSSRTS